MFKLKFPTSEIKNYAERYSYRLSEDELVKNKEPIQLRGYLTEKELQFIASWKTPRSKPKVATNSEEFIKEVTQIAFSTNNEKLRIEILTLLTGVGWPTASVILHFYHPDHYPIIDFRALYSLSRKQIKPQEYNFYFWKSYTDYTKKLADEAKVSMRILDKALWQ